jgi:ATP-dependent Lon protease
LENEPDAVRVSVRNLQDFLGVEKYRRSEAAKKDQVGIVCGLAWTSTGGVTLEIEVNTMPGKGELILTGKLGEVMRESARIAMTYVRSAAGRYGVKPAFFREYDFHIHIPEGAIPKDGPSAGVTMATALLSAASGLKVRRDIAMTGEVTLRGRVLPVGGLREKVLAAKQLGITEILVPAENEKDISEISDEIKEGLQLHYMETMDQILKEALVHGH